MWSIKYDKCVKCGTTNLEHVAKGLCRKCYTLKIEAEHKNHKINKRGISAAFLTKERLTELYTDKQLSLSDIGRIADCTRHTVYFHIKKFKIKLRDKAEARTIALDKGKIKYSSINCDGEIEEKTRSKVHFNENFFSKWSNEMAYVLGLIYTDGNIDPGMLNDPIRKTTLRIGRLTFAQREKELVEKFLNLIGSDSKILYRRRAKYENTTAGELYYFHINCDKYFEQLVKLGLTPNKSLSMKFPEIPDEYVRHFIRGCWDGDGSVYIEKRNGNLKTSFVCGSYEFIKALVEYLHKQGLSAVKLYEDRRSKKGNVSYYFRYGTKDSVKLFHYLYDGVPESQYLKRKYEIFKSYLDRNKIPQQLTLFK
ncbi:MAG: hypothetical protein CV087_17205 [Candidatus Brocadia sp. WS118]|nr:MAG: hypothetical protein CV087_17205 [Candidatus Brocadia sp. WS118]